MVVLEEKVSFGIRSAKSKLLRRVKCLKIPSPSSLEEILLSVRASLALRECEFSVPGSWHVGFFADRIRYQ